MRLIRKKGLTIIELLVVFGLLAALTLAAFIAVPTQLKKARDARRKSDLDRIKIALYDYYFDNDCFPSPDEIPECGGSFGSNGMAYLNNFPCDPFGTPYVYAVRKGGGECKQWFRIFANLEIITDPIIDKIHCRQGCGPDQHSDFNNGEEGCNYNYGVTSTNTQIYRNCSYAYVCNPGGVCQGFDDPWKSDCPVFYSDKNCNGECSKERTDNRCKNDSGKYVPEE